MNKIIPKIKSGDSLLLMNETVCFDSPNGITFFLPTYDQNKKTIGNDISFNFTFDYGAEENIKQVLVTPHENTIDIRVYNFGERGIFSATLNPLSFNIGETPILLYFSGQVIKYEHELNKRLIHLTVCIYQGKIK